MKAAFAQSAVLGALLSLAAAAEAQTTFTQVAEFNIPEANQGVGVDEDYFYAVDNTVLAKYRKDGTFVQKANYADIGVIHLDSATVLDGKILLLALQLPLLPDDQLD